MRTPRTGTRPALPGPSPEPQGSRAGTIHDRGAAGLTCILGLALVGPVSAQDDASEARPSIVVSTEVLGWLVEELDRRRCRRARCSCMASTPTPGSLRRATPRRSSRPTSSSPTASDSRPACRTPSRKRRTRGFPSSWRPTTSRSERAMPIMLGAIRTSGSTRWPCARSDGRSHGPSARSASMSAIEAMRWPPRFSDSGWKRATILDAVPPEARKLVSGHESLGYFADRYGFELVGAIVPGLSSQGEASAGELAELIETIRREEVPAIFVELGTPRVGRRSGGRGDRRKGRGAADRAAPGGRFIRDVHPHDRDADRGGAGPGSMTDSAGGRSDPGDTPARRSEREVDARDWARDRRPDRCRPRRGRRGLAPAGHPCGTVAEGLRADQRASRRRGPRRRGDVRRDRPARRARGERPRPPHGRAARRRGAEGLRDAALDVRQRGGLRAR